MNINDAYPSSFLKAADLNGQAVTVTMSHVDMETMGDGEVKPVLHFLGKDKGLVLNKTNAGLISHIYGAQTESWTNQQIILASEPVSFQGKIVDAIRVKPASAVVTAPVRQAPPAPEPEDKMPGQAAPDSEGGVFDDDIPF